MLQINPLLVCNLILKARAFHAREEADIQEDASNPTDDTITTALAVDNEESERDPLYNELKCLIEDLDPDQKAELVALVWVGREDYVAEDWYAALDEARRSAIPFTTEYLLSKPQVAEFLEDGLNKLGYYCS